MAKDAFYFSHDYNARNDEKILELRSTYGAEGYGIFWMVVEAMAEGSSGGLKATLIGGLSLGFGIPKHKLTEIMTHCIEVGLFFEKDGSYYSRRLLTHKQFRNSLSNWGRIGAEKRKAGLSPPTTKEMKGKEIEEIGIAPDMFKVFKKHFSQYPIDKERDYTSCLQIAYKIAESKGWSHNDVLASKKNDVLKAWEKIVLFTVSDKWYSTRSLFDINKEWQRLVQSMNGHFTGTHKTKEVTVIDNLRKLT
jgi:hypothetical protein